MLRSLFLGVINKNTNKNTRRINNIEPSDDIQEFASRVFEAFMESQKLENGVDKKETFFKEFDKISKLKEISISEDLKSDIYNDLTSQTEDNYNGINLMGSTSGVNVKTARGAHKDEGKDESKDENSKLIRLLVYDLGFKSKKAPQYSSMPEISLSSWWFTKSTSSLLKNHLKKINPYCDPGEEKIKRVLEEYEKYKEQDSDTVDSSTKPDKELALKQAIDEALKSEISTLPSGDHDSSKEESSLEPNDLLQRLKGMPTTKVSDDEFNGIVGFLDRLPKKELYAPKVEKLSIPSEAEGGLQDEGEPLLQPIPVEGKKRDKVAEFKEFLETKNLICNSDNLQKIFALHELYQTYEPFLEKRDEEIEREIRITQEDLGAFKNEIGELIFKKEENPESVEYVPKSPLSPGGELKAISTEEVEEILTFLNKNQKSKEIDNFLTLNPPLDIRKEEQIIVTNVERLKELKKNAITERLEKWYSMDNEYAKETYQAYEAYAKETYQAYEAYANATEQEKPVLKAIVLSKLTYGDHQNASKSLTALKDLNALDKLSEHHNKGIKEYQNKERKKAKQEEPNEIIKFITDIPNTILKAFGCIRTDDSSTKGSGVQSKS